MQISSKAAAGDDAEPPGPTFDLARWLMADARNTLGRRQPRGSMISADDMKLTVDQFEETQAFLEKAVQWAAIAVEMVEDRKFSTPPTPDGAIKCRTL
jgi:hypothetical protein